MEPQDFHQVDDKILTQVMRLGRTADIDWSEDDLAQMLEHVLSQDLEAELAGPNSVTSDQVRVLAHQATPPVRSFRDLFTADHPPADLLAIVKQYAKVVETLTDRVLPKQLASVLYLASIVTAQLRCGVGLTAHDDQRVLSGVRWALNQPWLNDTLAAVFEAFLADQPPQASKK